MSMISRLQAQAQGFDNLRSRGEQAMENFDTDKAITNGTEYAYRQGRQLLQQGKEQVSQLVGQERMQALEIGVPAAIKVGQGIRDYRASLAKGDADNGVSKIGGGEVDPDSFLGRQQAMARDRVRRFGGGGDGGDDDADTLKYDTQRGTMINRYTNEPISDSRYDTSLQTGSGLRDDQTLRQERVERLSNPREPQQNYNPVPERQEFDEGDMFSQRAAARSANAAYQQRASAEASAQAERDTISSLPSVDELTRSREPDPQTVVDRPPPATGEQPRPIEPQIQKPSIGTEPVEGEYTGARQPSRQYPQSRGEAQAPTNEPIRRSDTRRLQDITDKYGARPEVQAQADDTRAKVGDFKIRGEPTPQRIPPPLPDQAPTAAPRTTNPYIAPERPTPQPRPQAPLQAQEAQAPPLQASAGFSDDDVSKLGALNAQLPAQEAQSAQATPPAQAAQATPPAPDAGGQRAGPPDAGNDTSRVGQPLPDAAGQRAAPPVADDEPYQTKPPVASVAPEAEEAVGKAVGEEAVGSFLDFIPGLDVIGAGLGIAGLASTMHTSNAKTISPPQPQPLGTPSLSTAFDSAPVYDSSDYHNA